MAENGHAAVKASSVWVRSGFPAQGRYCFGRAAPSRVPRPAATTTSATLFADKGMLRVTQPRIEAKTRKRQCGPRRRLSLKFGLASTLSSRSIGWTSRIFADAIDKNKVAAESGVTHFERKSVFRRAIPGSRLFDAWKFHDDNRLRGPSPLQHVDVATSSKIPSAIFGDRIRSACS